MDDFADDPRRGAGQRAISGLVRQHPRDAASIVRRQGSVSVITVDAAYLNYHNGGLRNGEFECGRCNWPHSEPADSRRQQALGRRDTRILAWQGNAEVAVPGARRASATSRVSSPGCGRRTGR